MILHPNFNSEPLKFFHGIPSFVSDSDYTEGFGLQWITHSKTQLDSKTGLPITKERMERMLGSQLSFLRGKVVLEAGCGAGRFTEILLQNGAVVTAFDLSNSVIANFDNNGSNESLRIIQASITNLPFSKEVFDLVFCPGVIQHTPNPKKSIESLYNQVKPGGHLIFDQYRFNISTLFRSAWIVRLVAKRLSPEKGLQFTDNLVKFWLPLHRQVKDKRLLEIALFRISPITSHYSSYPEMSEHDQIQWAKLNTHDNLTDTYKRLTGPKKLLKILEQLGAVDIKLTIMPYTIEVSCQKPSSEQSRSESARIAIVKIKGRTVQSG